MTFNRSRRLARGGLAVGAAMLALLAQPAFAVNADKSHLKPVATISDTRFTIDTPQGNFRCICRRIGTSCNRR
jgi:hypothetical protein